LTVAKSDPAESRPILLAILVEPCHESKALLARDQPAGRTKIG
jgi:hypothetical protein